MTIIEAVYEGGVFKPAGPVALPEKQRVQLEIRPVAPTDIMPWLAEVRRTRERLFAEHGLFPDSACDIAEDRMRDV